MKKTVAIYGNPIQQSLSPDMHNLAFKLLDLNYHYSAYDIIPENLEAGINAIRVLDFAGANITIPHKEKVIKFLDYVDPRASAIGAVNTIVNKNGYLSGYNTDGDGYLHSLEEELNIKLSKQKIMVIGAGGAARAIIYCLLEKKLEDVYIFNRSIAKAENLASDFANYGHLNILEVSKAVDKIAGMDIIINTSPVGMFPDLDQSPIDCELIHSKQIVSDIIYNPLKTKLLIQAEKKSAKIHNGVGMLVHQGALAFKLWTGLDAPITEMYELVKGKLLEQNKRKY